eukprot:scaffold7328_cov314-Pinguiococcus_pyrenoidosus.AAC.5
MAGTSPVGYRNSMRNITPAAEQMVDPPALGECSKTRTSPMLPSASRAASSCAVVAVTGTAPVWCCRNVSRIVPSIAVAGSPLEVAIADAEAGGPVADPSVGAFHAAVVKVRHVVGGGKGKPRPAQGAEPLRACCAGPARAALAAVGRDPRAGAMRTALDLPHALCDGPLDVAAVAPLSRSSDARVQSVSRASVGADVVLPRAFRHLRDRHGVHGSRGNQQTVVLDQQRHVSKVLEKRHGEGVASHGASGGRDALEVDADAVEVLVADARDCVQRVLDIQRRRVMADGRRREASEEQREAAVDGGAGDLLHLVLLRRPAIRQRGQGIVPGRAVQQGAVVSAEPDVTVAAMDHLSVPLIGVGVGGAVSGVHLVRVVLHAEAGAAAAALQSALKPFAGGPREARPTEALSGPGIAYAHVRALLRVVRIVDSGRQV